jgi:hypothetical protein
MKFEPPTEQQKRNWAHAEVSQRAEFGGHVYELAEHPQPTVFILTRDHSMPIRPIMGQQVGHLTLVGVNEAPAEALINNIKQANTW